MALSNERILFSYVLILVMCVSQITSRSLSDAYVSKKHELWMAQHGRVYKSAAEKEMRLSIFKKNVEFIESFNSFGNTSYKLGVNQFSDLTKEEFKAYFHGYKHPTDLKLPLSPSFKYESVSEVPPHLDWRKEGAVSDVKPQNGCDYVYVKRKLLGFCCNRGCRRDYATGKLIDLSEQQLVDCNRNGSGGCHGGYAESAFNYIAKNGINSENDYPYHAADETCVPNANTAATITGYEMVPANNETALMMAVSKQPVSVNIDVSCIEFGHYSSGVLTQHCGTNLNHVVTVVGYGILDGIKYWLLKNSWGPAWGHNGYIKIQRDASIAEGLCGIAMQASYPTA